MQSCIFIMTVSLIFCVLQLNVSPPNRLCRHYVFVQKRLGFRKDLLSQALKCCFSQSTGLRSSKKFNNMITGSRCGPGTPFTQLCLDFEKVRNMGYCSLILPFFRKMKLIWPKSMSRYRAVAFSHHTPSRPFKQQWEGPDSK